MTLDIDNDDSVKMLKEIIKLWITIRGFSYASAIADEYKWLCRVFKHTRSLRKELKKHSSCDNTE